MKERERQLNADIQGNLKALSSIHAELDDKTERYNQLKKHSQELAIQNDNLKISKETQALKNKEQIKAATELEVQIDSLTRKLEGKDAEMAKQKNQMSKLRGQVNEASQDTAKEIDIELANLNAQFEK